MFAEDGSRLNPLAGFVKILTRNLVCENVHMPAALEAKEPPFWSLGRTPEEPSVLFVTLFVLRKMVLS